MSEPTSTTLTVPVSASRIARRFFGLKSLLKRARRHAGTWQHMRAGRRGLDRAQF
jgi:hypothetical protein